MELWKDYGIVSYNMAVNREILPITYYNLQLACKDTKPKLVVIDAFSADFEKKIDDKSKTYLHDTLDPYPLSYTKYLAVKDLFDSKDMLNNTIDYLFNFSMYHTRWNELKENDFTDLHNYGKGAESRIAVGEPAEIGDFNANYEEEETVNMKYLRKSIEYCKNNNIEVLITYLPYPASDKQIATSKYVQNICDDYNVRYINFLNMNIVDYSTDCSDSNSHLNPSGGRKVTKYLGKYITDNYKINNFKENKEYKFWDTDYDEYIDYQILEFKYNTKNLNNYLMLLYNQNNIKYEIKISSKLKIEEGSILQKLLLNINNNYEIDDTVFEGKTEETIKITTWDNRSGKEIQTVWF